MGKTLQLAVLLALSGTATQAHALEKVVFGTNWVAQGEHGGYYQALADGTYEACGLDVEIKPGGPQANNRILLPVGKIDFLMGGNMLEAFASIEQGIPTKVVAVHFQKEPQVLMTHPDQGLDTWESLKTIPILLGKDGLNSFYRWMVSEFGFSLEQVRPYTFNPAPFIANPQSAQQGYVTSEPYAIEKEAGFKPVIFLLADYGYNSYSTTVETRDELIEEKPEVVQCFVDGSAIGWYNFLYGDNSKAVDMIMKANPGMTKEQIDFTIDKLKEYEIVDSGEALTKGIGAMSDEHIQSFFDKMVEADVIKASIPYGQSYTLQFVNKGVGLDVKKKLTDG